jgi:histidine ammonia-lyase
MNTTETITLGPGPATLDVLRRPFEGPVRVTLDDGWRQRVAAGRDVIERSIAANRVVYGVNTGFGKLADRLISPEDVVELQHRLIRSHQVGVGPLLPDRVVRAILLLKVLCLFQGYSAVRPSVLELLVGMLEADILPCVPAQGSVGASGDLAPLAHLTAGLLGQGEVRVNGEMKASADALAQAGLQPLELGAKEAIALINGTQVSTALALCGLFSAERALRAALLAGALSTEAINGNIEPFDERIHRVRRQAGQQAVGTALAQLVAGSQILSAPGPRRTQDMYSFRCQPQVVGAALDLLRYAGDVLEREANAVSDNPLVFADADVVLSGGNFHAQPVAFAADTIALALCEIGSISERRQFVLNDPALSGLPAFLTRVAGLNSGMTMVQVTSAALVAENQTRATPGSVGNVPTVSSQEDHVSMATHTARRLLEMAANATQIVANELVMASQGVEFRLPSSPGPASARVYSVVRELSPTLDDDRRLSGELEAVAAAIAAGRFDDLVEIETLRGLGQQRATP